MREDALDSRACLVAHVLIQPWPVCTALLVEISGTTLFVLYLNHECSYCKLAINICPMLAGC